MKVFKHCIQQITNPLLNIMMVLIMIENVLTLLSCIYVQKYNCMNDNYFLCLIDHAFTLELCGWIENVALIHKDLKYTN
jgi:hypothetical protein